ncbi:MAG: DMT family transporter [Clostridiales bacterium]|nr:DMT family transporter [Clostridiales bacterium]
MAKNKAAIIFALLAAALYAINVPLSKILLMNISPTMLAGLLYLGAGIGIGILLLCRKIQGKTKDEKWLEKSDLTYTIAMVVLDIAAPIFLMYGILNTTSANASLLNNFKIVATSIIALVFFKEAISKKLWTAILLVTAASVILGFEGSDSFVFNKGSLLVLCACACWGIENNCTKSISDKSSEKIVLIKGVFSGLGSVIVALAIGESFPAAFYMLAAMVLGFVAYGLSINFYIMAQKDLGAAKTSAFYSVAPFLGVGFSFVILGERPGIQFYISLIIMVVSTVIMVKETLGNEKLYSGYVHTHQHRHGDVVHTHAHRHFVYNPMHIHSHSHNKED